MPFDPFYHYLFLYVPLLLSSWPLLTINIFIIFYRPKGVMTSFRAMTVTTKELAKILRATSKDRILSYLPMAHGMERWLGEVSALMSFI